MNIRSSISGSYKLGGSACDSNGRPSHQSVMTVTGLAGQAPKATALVHLAESRISS